MKLARPYLVSYNVSDHRVAPHAWRRLWRRLQGLPSGQPHDGRNLRENAGEIANRMIRIFTRNDRGQRPVYGGTRMFQEDPYWKDLILFYEFYHGDSGAGLGASHQTGGSALLAALIDDWRR